MNNKIILLGVSLIISAGFTVQAQLGRPATVTPDSAMHKIFGTNLNFSADLEVQIKMPQQEDEMTMVGKIYFAGGDSRTEMDMTKMKGSKMPPHATDQMKAMGMDKMISISIPDKKTVYMIYPGLDSYAMLTVPNAPSATNDTKLEKTDLGKETLDGHSCTKTKYKVVEPGTGENVTLIAWTTSDLKNYPIKIEIDSSEAAQEQKAPASTTLHFTNINTDTPQASLFEPPLGYRVYTNVQAMMQTEMIRKMGGGNGMPPNHPGMPANHPAVPADHP